MQEQSNTFAAVRSLGSATVSCNCWLCITGSATVTCDRWCCTTWSASLWLPLKLYTRERYSHLRLMAMNTRQRYSHRAYAAHSSSTVSELFLITEHHRGVAERCSHKRSRTTFIKHISVALSRLVISHTSVIALYKRVFCHQETFAVLLKFLFLYFISYGACLFNTNKQ